jgi:hypothetical protein
MIYKALVKYGYSSFKLEILENSEPNILIEREQYYLDLLNPEYNILKKAGSLLGFRHSEASRELVSFTSARKAAEFIGVHHSHIAKSLGKFNFYLGRGFLVHKSDFPYSEIINSKAYIEAKNAGESGFKHSEASKELIRKANLGRSHSLETIQKLSANSANSKAVLVINN